MHSFRVCPTDNPGITRMEFDYYHLHSGEKFNEYLKFVRQVAMEDFELCEKAQENLEKGVYTEGILNPDKETGVACEWISKMQILGWAANMISSLSATSTRACLRSTCDRNGTQTQHCI